MVAMPCKMVGPRVTGTPNLRGNQMKHSDFVIGETFWWSRLPWRCTDIGTRIVMAIRLDTYPEGCSFGAPPNGLLEIVFDESAVKECGIAPPLDEHGNPPKPRVGEIHSLSL